MTFSNPASNAAASAGAYVRALLAVLGERDPLEVMEELDGWLDRRFAGLPEPFGPSLEVARAAGLLVAAHGGLVGKDGSEGLLAGTVRVPESPEGLRLLVEAPAGKQSRIGHPRPARAINLDLSDRAPIRQLRLQAFDHAAPRPHQHAAMSAAGLPKLHHHRYRGRFNHMVEIPVCHFAQHAKPLSS